MRNPLAAELKRLRKGCGITLRDVERSTGISNAYLSQIETGKVANPSAHLLRKLAEVYGVAHEQLLLAAGYLDRVPTPAFPPRIAALLAGVELSPDDEHQIVSFVRTLVSRKDPT